MLRKIKCPICNKCLMSVPNTDYVSFDIRCFTNKVFCANCKRNIKYSIQPWLNKESSEVGDNK